MMIHSRLRPLFLVLLLILVPTLFLSGQEVREHFERIDENYLESEFEANRKLLEQLEQKVSTSKERAGYLWRLSRNTLYLADAMDRSGASSDTLLEEYKRGEELADKAVSLDPNNHHAYYWRASNTGRWGQTKGVLNSLMKAGPMKDDLERAVNIEAEHSDSYYVLGMLYASVPKLLSFGNKDYAVSYSRKALDAYVGLKTKYSYYLKLGEHLWDRDWSARKRRREFDKLEKEYRDAQSAAERNKYYEGVFDSTASRVYARGGVEKLSDREEAKKVISWLIETMEEDSDLSEHLQATLQDAKELWRSWN